LPLAGIIGGYTLNTTPGIAIIAQEKCIGLGGNSENIIFPITHKFTARV
jgi:hypothetical protein